MGKIPEPPPTGSPDLKASRDVVPKDEDLGSKPEIMDEVGETLPFLPIFAEDCG
jgi:hypothetical protein